MLKATSPSPARPTNYYIDPPRLAHPPTTSSSFPLSSSSPSSVRAMDPALRRRSRLPLHLLVVASTVLLSLAARSGAEVITLTEETFSDKIKEKDTVWFVQFCVPWCKHCKNLGTLWEDLGKVMEGADEIEIGQVDCGLSKPVCSKVDIHSYPTFKVFYDGEEVAKYKGPRDVESLKNFVLNEAEKAGEAKLQDD